MNLAMLARHYDVLTPGERLPLLLAAQARADALEHDRLTRSAPHKPFPLPDYWGLLDGCEEVAKHYVLRQLESAAYFWWLRGSWEHGEHCAADSNPRHQQWLGKTIQLAAYTFVVRADGWKLFCHELQVDPDFLVSQLPGSDKLTRTEEQARLLAYSADQAAAYVGELSDHGAATPGHDTGAVHSKHRLATAADVARAMREMLNQYVEAWS